MPPSKEGHTEEKWPRWVSRSSGKDQASRNRSSDAAGVLEDCSAKRRGRSNTSSQTQTECTLCQIHTTSTCTALLELAGGQRIGWYSVGNDAKDNEVDEAGVLLAGISRGLRCRNTVLFSGGQVLPRFAWRTLGCPQIKIRAAVCAGRRLNRRQQQWRRRMRGNPARVQTIKVESVGNSNQRVGHRASSSQPVSGRYDDQCGIRPSISTSMSAPSKTVSWAVLAEYVLMQPHAS